MTDNTGIMFEQLTLTSLQEYVGAPLVDPDGNIWKLESVERIAPYAVEFKIEGFAPTRKADTNELHRMVSYDYARAQARGLTNE
jgi:hypothetical protein